MASILRKRKTVGDITPTNEIDKVLASLRKDHGTRTIIQGSDVRQPYRIPTGIFAFDYATLGGIPHSRMTMVHGPKHAGKSYFSDRVIMGAQQTMLGMKAVKIDVEGTHDSTWSSKTGVDNESLILVQPDSGEQAVDIAVALTHTREVSLIVIDSLAALVPMKEQDASAEDAQVGLQSRMITKMLRCVNSAQISERKRDHHVTILLLNQQRSKIGGWSPTGDPLSLPGGKALGHFTTLEARLKNKENIKKDSSGNETLAWNDHAFTVEKNKMHAGVRQGEFRMMRRADEDLGLSEGEIDDAATMLAYAKIEGWYTGSGKGGYTLAFGGYESVRAANADEMIKTLYADREYLWSLRCHLIAESARKQGMTDEFVNYLLSGVET